MNYNVKALWAKTIHLLFWISILLSIFVNSSNAAMGIGDGNGNGNGKGIAFAQPYALRDRYLHLKRFDLTGNIQLTYRDYTSELVYTEGIIKTGYTSFEQHYRVGLTGYIYHPRLALFSASITSDIVKTEGKDDYAGWVDTTKAKGYDFSIHLLPFRPINLQLFTSKSTTTTDVSGALTNIMPETTWNRYGAHLVSTYKKYPIMTFDYVHWDRSYERITGRYEVDYFSGDRPTFIIIRETIQEKTEDDKFDFLAKGELKRFRTNYVLRAGTSYHSSSAASFDSNYLRISTTTKIKPNNFLSNYLIYQNINDTTLINFESSLHLSPIKRLQHSYNFGYMTSESSINKVEAFSASGLWRYKISNKIYAKLSLTSRFGERNNIEDTYNKFNFNIKYGKPFKRFDFDSYYDLSYSNEKLIDEYTSTIHNIGLVLSTKTFKRAKIYSRYNFTYRIFDYTLDRKGISYQLTWLGIVPIEKTISESTTDTEHRFVLGIDGKVPKRVRWNLEFEYRRLASEHKGAWQNVWLGDKQWAEELTNYILRGNVRYPIGRRGSITLEGSYTTGTANAEDVKSYYYEGRLNYTFFRNLRFNARWREEWRNKGSWYTGLTSKTGYYLYRDTNMTQYQINLDYSWRRFVFSLEYYLEEIEEIDRKITNTRLFGTVSRAF